MKYKDIIEDKQITKILNTIDAKNDNEMNHGLKHTINVIENIKKITTLLNIDNETLEYLMIAGYLHDIGQLYKNKNHTLEGERLASKYLKDKINKKWYNQILSAIKNHHEKETVNNISLFDHIVLFADKMDFSYKRLDLNYIEKHKKQHFIENSIKEINFDIKNNIFIVIIKINNEQDIVNIKSWNYYPNIERRIHEFADKINMNYKIKFIVASNAKNI